MDALGKLLNQVGNMPGIGPILAPFVKTPYNAIRYGLERAPVTNLVPLGKKLLDPKASRADKAEQAGRAVTGYVVMLPFLMAYAQGNLTGATPANDTEKDQWQAEGKQPYSMKIGDRWVSFNLFPALHATLVTTVNLADAVQTVRGEKGESEDFGTEALQAVLAVGNEVVQRPLFGGLSDLAEAMESPEKVKNFSEQTAANAVSSAIPGSAALRWASNIADPYERSANTLEEKAQRGLPWRAQDLPVARTAFGDERMKEGQAWDRALNPLRRSEDRPDRAQYEYREAFSAEEDRKIRQAVKKVADHKRAPDEYPEPSDQDLEWADAARRGKDPAFARYRSEEDRTRREEKTASRGRSKERTPMERLLAMAGVVA